MKILTFAASNSKDSINHKLAVFTASLVKKAKIETIRIDDYELPIFSIEREHELGHPSLAKKFYEKIGSADALIISYAEHNGNYTAAFKNLFDWTSRINGKVFQNKPTLMLSTSPGKRGAASVLNLAVTSAPFYGADLRASISIPSFFDAFDLKTETIIDQEITASLKKATEKLM